jgi:membrane-associated PAP2 superfamily phosphatase
MNLRPMAAGRDAAWIALSLLAWDLSEFGRSARHVSHWAFGVNDGGPGRCFPSGHASAAFSLFSVAQTVRGAHYPSHSMWTAWVCFATSALLWHAAQPLLIRRHTEIRTWCPRFFRH